MDSPPISIHEIVDLCRALPGFWLDHFRYKFSRDRWELLTPDGDRHIVGIEAMPEIAAQLGGWSASREVAA
jgi:hypothetical protein